MLNPFGLIPLTSTSYLVGLQVGLQTNGKLVPRKEEYWYEYGAKAEGGIVPA